ncbi:hypothetical protein [Yersinia vastinensis]|uniref:hypothetical protein n=1 Tax=Yersinia vastinensis TaxID=2890318 RepID=UPI00092D23E0
MFEEYLTNYCWKRDQSNTLPIDRKESKAIPTIIMPISSQSHRRCCAVTSKGINRLSRRTFVTLAAFLCT